MQNNGTYVLLAGMISFLCVLKVTDGWGIKKELSVAFDRARIRDK
jgi:hypothetical protein